MQEYTKPETIRYKHSADQSASVEKGTVNVPGGTEKTQVSFKFPKNCGSGEGV